MDFMHDQLADGRSIRLFNPDEPVSAADAAFMSP